MSKEKNEKRKSSSKATFGSILNNRIHYGRSLIAESELTTPSPNIREELKILNYCYSPKHNLADYPVKIN